MVHTYDASGRCWECGETLDGVPIGGTEKKAKKGRK